MSAGKKFLDAGSAHFKQLVNADLDSLEVPEWDAVIYRPAVISMQRMIRISHVQATEGNLAMMVQAIIEIARTEDNKPLFAPADKDLFLKGMDPTVITRVGAWLSAYGKDRREAGAEGPANGEGRTEVDVAKENLSETR